ncbi:hypothetical protein [Rhizobium sp. RM]|uniref:hypothetical protein n=1 Tax=Rhizobium sp. RM TaxID=2748079 RepID=UPI00110EDA38|nr:hypothetical protein [Rhizobium sp. RM]NWJ24779.1 hypothetical protein [Rhizobium sp. RM]TMV16577.1 hypothetical protein BJG94_19270 [Rhizobium sp. Td3]
MSNKKQEWSSETDGKTITLTSTSETGEQQSISIPSEEMERALKALMRSASKAQVMKWGENSAKEEVASFPAAQATAFRLAAARDKQSAILRVVSTAGAFDFVFEREAALHFTDSATKIGAMLRSPDGVKMN